MKCALSIKFCLFGVTLVKMFALPKINRETPQSPTSRLLHCQFIADLLLVVGQMLEGLLVQTCFSQHLVLVEQQLAVLVVHFVRRRLNRPEKEQTTLSVSNILYQARMTENLQEPLCFSGNWIIQCVCARSHQLTVLHRWHKDRKQAGLIRSTPEWKRVSSTAVVTNAETTEKTPTGCKATKRSL